MHSVFLFAMSHSRRNNPSSDAAFRKFTGIPLYEILLAAGIFILDENRHLPKSHYVSTISLVCCNMSNVNRRRKPEGVTNVFMLAYGIFKNWFYLFKNLWISLVVSCLYLYDHICEDLGNFSHQYCYFS